MTDEQIMQGLKWCYQAEGTCGDCPYRPDDIKKAKCHDRLGNDVIDLIKRQQAEIDRLKTEKDNLIKTYSECQIAFLREFVEKLGKRFASNGELSWTAYHSVMGSMEELFASMTGKEMGCGE